jgi:hypothetical protein
MSDDPTKRGAVCARIAPIPLAVEHDGRLTESLETETRDLDLKKKVLYEKLKREADGGASLSELHAEIDKAGRLLTAGKYKSAA